MFRSLSIALACLALAGASATAGYSKTLNGFDIANLSVPRKFVKSGGPPKDGIPSIDRPRFVAASDADYLAPEDRILGVSIDGIAKAYPIKILDRHEVVNDRIGNTRFIMTYCPLCGSGMAFEANVDGPKSFGVSGLLYNSDVLLFDRETETLWSQIGMKAVAGPLEGRSLEPIATSSTTWASWKREYPDSLALSNNQGLYHPKLYEEEMYEGYPNSSSIWFPLENKSRALRAKAVVIGISINGEAKAYPLAELAKAVTPFEDLVGNKPIRIEFEKEAISATISDPDGKPIPAMTLYWFAWHAFHPNTEIYKAPKQRARDRKSKNADSRAIRP